MPRLDALKPARGGAPVGRFAIRGRGRCGGSEGFTLIEALVATTVLALFTAYLLRGVVGLHAQAAWVDTRASDEQVLAALLDDALSRRTAPAGTSRGERDGRRWSITASPLDIPTPSLAIASPSDTPIEGTWMAQKLVIRVEAPGRPLIAETVRLVVAK